MSMIIFTPFNVLFYRIWKRKKLLKTKLEKCWRMLKKVRTVYKPRLRLDSRWCYTRIFTPLNGHYLIICFLQESADAIRVAILRKKKNPLDSNRGKIGSIFFCGKAHFFLLLSSFKHFSFWVFYEMWFLNQKTIKCTSKWMPFAYYTLRKLR